MADEKVLISGEDGDLGERFKEFTIDYTVTAESGSAAVTEMLGSMVLRSYTAASGEAQTATVPVTGLIVGQHTVTIKAEADGETAERNYTFTLPAVWIDCEETDLGDKIDTFSFECTPTSYSGAELSVSECINGKLLRTFPCESGTVQRVHVDLRKLIEGEHSVTISAECGEDQTEVVAAFRVIAMTPQSGGTVQELQDEQERPVFPVTLAQAVVTSNGKSVEKFALDEVAAVSMEHFAFEKITTSCVWTVPKAYLQRFYVIAIGGGGGGCGGSRWKNGTPYWITGGGGGAGGNMVTKTLTLTEGEKVEIVCGAGGSCGATVGSGWSPGGAGGNTSFGAYLTGAGGETLTGQTGAGEDQTVPMEEYNTMFFMMVRDDIIKGGINKPIAIRRRGTDGKTGAESGGAGAGGKGGDTLVASGSTYSSATGGGGAGVEDGTTSAGGSGGCYIIYFR